MSVKSAAALGIALLLVGLLVGYLIWGRAAPSLVNELATVKERLAAETRRADETQSKLAETESELKRAAEGLKSEREFRQRLEQLVSKGRK